MIEIKLRIRNATTKEVVAYELIGIPFNSGYAFYFKNDAKKVYHSNSNELFRVCGILCPIRDQFTGLQDVTDKTNPKDIYNSDIVQLDGKIYYISFWFGSFCMTEKFNNEIYHFTFGEFDADEIERIKIIGNIYENPELLK